MFCANTSYAMVYLPVEGSKQVLPAITLGAAQVTAVGATMAFAKPSCATAMGVGTLLLGSVAGLAGLPAVGVAPLVEASLASGKPVGTPPAPGALA